MSFGFIRDKSIQARNPFAPFKSAFRRTQFGGTLGGPLPFLNFGEGGPVTKRQRQKLFLRFFERRQRNETGFFTSDVAQGLTSSVTIQAIPGFNPTARTFTNLTAEQATRINSTVNTGLQLLAAGQTANGANLRRARLRVFRFERRQTGLTGSNSLITPNDGSACEPAISPITPTSPVIGSRFFCPARRFPSILETLGAVHRFSSAQRFAACFPGHRPLELFLAAHRPQSQHG
jgi:hypothetical protein